MSVIVVASSAVLSLSCALFAIDVGRVAWDRAKAQTAADAAALAAVAESGPYGSGNPELPAKTYADANGAQLLQCLCDLGATAMQVKVSLHNVTAQARAVLDPSLLRPSVVAFDAGGMRPGLADAVKPVITIACDPWATSNPTGLDVSAIWRAARRSALRALPKASHR